MINQEKEIKTSKKGKNGGRKMKNMLKVMLVFIMIYLLNDNFYITQIKFKTLVIY